MFLRSLFQVTEDIDKNSKKVKEKLNHIQLNHNNYYPISQQKHAICYHYFHHCVLSFACMGATNRARQARRVRACAPACLRAIVSVSLESLR